MKRGVPPTARKARTGELTPPGITCSARSKSCALLRPPWRGALSLLIAVASSVDLAGAGGVAFFRPAFGAGLAFFTGRQCPEEAVGNDVAHARAEARVQRLVE